MFNLGFSDCSPEGFKTKYKRKQQQVKSILFSPMGFTIFSFRSPSLFKNKYRRSVGYARHTPTVGGAKKVAVHWWIIDKMVAGLSHPFS